MSIGNLTPYLKRKFPRELCREITLDRGRLSPRPVQESMTIIRLGFSLLLALICAACTIMVDAKIEPVGLVASRPRSDIYPSDVADSEWIKYNVVVDKNMIYSARRVSATIFMELTDCKGLHIDNLDLYVKDISIFQTGSVDEHNFKSIVNSPGRSIVASFYIKNDIIGQQKNLCAKFRGGGFVGPKISSKTYSLK
ncbi:hypothetical protein [Rhizobium alvei]|uniref:Uncharacterized protein n=1 Tax=Rhizobium alvei TaxID=1132659 RepID=A0ABT8YL18_9HYPH|nr:hypothetical protein [Rhizobium alvei]MDO6964043.1 hypothetical protein [Rhizobium alvei]